MCPVFSHATHWWQGWETEANNAAFSVDALHWEIQWTERNHLLAVVFAVCKTKIVLYCHVTLPLKQHLLMGLGRPCLSSTESINGFICEPIRTRLPTTCNISNHPIENSGSYSMQGGYNYHVFAQSFFEGEIRSVFELTAVAYDGNAIDLDAVWACHSVIASEKKKLADYNGFIQASHAYFLKHQTSLRAILPAVTQSNRMKFDVEVRSKVCEWD